jgi:hypothetical protein
MGNPPVKLLDRVRQCIRLKGYSIGTEKSIVYDNEFFRGIDGYVLPCFEQPE